MPSESREIQQVRTENSTNDELDSRWAKTIATKLSQRYTIIERDDKFHLAILESNKTKEVNHILHAVLTLFTCIWGIVWIIEIAGEKKIHRVRLSVDSQGQILEERISVP